VLLDGKPYRAKDILRRVVVRPATPDEVSRWRELVRLVSQTLLHVAEVDGHWVALLGWSSAALKWGHGIAGWAGRPGNGSGA